MRSKGWVALLLLPLSQAGADERGAVANKSGGCRQGVVEGELSAGQPFERVIGNDLTVKLQPIASGWILRVVPVGGMTGALDYAALATPPYESVTPLSVSTDFRFRAQDAVGWNPRHFRYASDGAMFGRLDEGYRKVFPAGSGRGAGGVALPVDRAAETRLFGEVARTPEGTLTVLDARLAAGTADQAPQAASVAQHFASTAHRLEADPAGRATPLGKLLWIRFRIALELPAGFRADRALKVVARPCPSST